MGRMVTFNRDMHVAAHDRVTIAHGRITAAQAYADLERPDKGQVPTAEYIDSVRLLVDCVSEYGDAVAELGAILSWKSKVIHREITYRD
jgi:hypothetical protein